MRYEKPQIDVLESATNAIRGPKGNVVLDSICPTGNGDPSTKTACMYQVNE